MTYYANKNGLHVARPREAAQAVLLLLNKNACSVITNVMVSVIKAPAQNPHRRVPVY